MKKTLLITAILSLSTGAFASSGGDLPFKKVGKDFVAEQSSESEKSQTATNFSSELNSISSSIKTDMLQKIRQKQNLLNMPKQKVVGEAKTESKVVSKKVEKVKTIAKYNQIKNAEGSVTIPAMPDHDGVVRINGSEQGTYVVQIAKGYLNLIDLPFVEPIADTINDVEIIIKESGMYVYTNSEGSAGVWIYDKQNPNLSVSLVFIPQNIAPRKIEIWYPDDALYADYSPNPVPPSEGLKALDLGKAKEWEAKSSSYVDQLVSIFDTVSAGKIPSGYSFTRINAPSSGLVCGSDNLVGTKKQLLEGSSYRVDVYEVENTGRYTLDVNEAACYSRGVAAIGMYPSVRIEPGKSNEMYVVYPKFAKDKKKTIQDGYRPMLIERGE